MKKRVLFVHEQMNIGGVESALLAALNLLDPEKYDLHLMLFKLGGPLFDAIPKYVTVHEVPFKPISQYRFEHGYVRGLVHAFLTGHWIYAMRLAWAKLVWCLWYSRKGLGYHHIEAKLNAQMVDKPKLPSKVDFALAYTSGFRVGYLVLKNFKTATKAFWFHNADSQKIANSYANFVKKYDKVFGCSKDMTELFNKIYAGQIKLQTMPHIVDKTLYISRAKDAPTFCDEYQGMRILSVGRLSPQKGVEFAVETAAKLKADGLDFRWYWLGGKSEGSVEYYLDLPRKFGVEDRFVFLGETTNPFGYYRDCDIYVQPSRWEAYCLTVAEARAFNKPIVLTDFVGAREQIKDGETGLIVPIEDANALYHAVKCVLEDLGLQKSLSKKLARVSEDEVSCAKVAWESFLNTGK